MGKMGEACLPSNAYYPRTPDYTLYSGVQVCWSEHSDSPFVYGFMSLNYGLGTMTATTFPQCFQNISNLRESNYVYICEMWLFDLFFLSSANLICRDTDISKYLKQTLGIRDNESRLYFIILQF